MWVDPVVHEIHVIRQKLMDDAGGDLHEVIRLAREHRDPGRLITKGRPRRPEGWVGQFGQVDPGKSAEKPQDIH